MCKSEGKYNLLLTIGLSILGIMVTIGLTLYFSNKEKDPVYYISTPVLIAQTVNGENSLRIVWNGKDISDAAYVNIALWNEGRQYIDSSDIEIDNPIRIVPLDHRSKIIAVHVEKTSRPDLSFSTQIVADPSGYDYVVLNIENNDALEYMDGVYLHILYTGSVNSSWGVIGRIKGVPGGIRALGNKIIFDYYQNTVMPWYIVLIFLIFFIYGATRYMFLRKRKLEISTISIIEPIFIFILLVYIIYEKMSVIVQLPVWLRGII